MQETTATPNEIAQLITSELSLSAIGHGGSGDGQQTVVVDRDDTTASIDGVEALAERNGYFVFSADASEITLVAYEDCEWKSR